MLEFDRYVPETWLDQGIAIAVEVTDAMTAVVAPLQKAKARLIPAASAAVVAVGVALSNLPFITASGVGDPVQVTEPAPSQYGADDVPPAHWGKLVALLRNTKALPADDTSGDPAPLG